VTLDKLDNQYSVWGVIDISGANEKVIGLDCLIGHAPTLKQAHNLAWRHNKLGHFDHMILHAPKGQEGTWEMPREVPKPVPRLVRLRVPDAVH
jgi:hypothetical protein